MASLERFDFQSEDLFTLAAKIIDDIFSDPQNAPNYISEVWDNMKIEMKKSSGQVPPQNDLDSICAILLYTVAATFSLHWRSYYNSEIVTLLLNTLDKHQIITDKEELKDIMQNLCRQAEELEDWIIHYENNSQWLSDEIEYVLQEKDPTPIKNKKETRNNKNWFTEGTFKYKGYDSDDLKQRLDLIADELLKGFVKTDTPKQWIKNLFSGIPMPKSDKIVWKGTASELAYFFRTLNGKKLITKTANDFLWNIVASHFKVETQYKNKARKINIDPESLSHNTEMPNYANMKKLDDIIRLFDGNLLNYLQEKIDEQENERYEDMAQKDLRFFH